MTTPHSPQPRVGDVVHGHRWDGAAWVPVADPAAQHVSPVTSVDAARPSRTGGLAARLSSWRQPPRRGDRRSGGSPGAHPSQPTQQAKQPKQANPQRPKQPQQPRQQRKQRKQRQTRGLGVIVTSLLVGGGVLTAALVTDRIEESTPRPTVPPTPAASWSSTRPASPLPASGMVRDVASFYGTYPTLTHTGTGKTSIPLPAGVESGYLEFSMQGGSGASISLRDADGRSVSSLYCDIPDDGAPCRDALLGRRNEPRTILVDAYGLATWTLTLAPVWTMPTRDEPGSGTGPATFLYTGPAGEWRLTTADLKRGTSVSARYGNQSVHWWAHEDRPADVDEMFTGPAVVQVSAEGAWTIERV